jgi:hypothetical protein
VTSFLLDAIFRIGVFICFLIFLVFNIVYMI